MFICKNCGATFMECTGMYCCENQELIEVPEINSEFLNQVAEIKLQKKAIDAQDKELTSKLKEVYSKVGLKKVIANGKSYSMSVTTEQKLDEEGLATYIEEHLDANDIEKADVFIKKINPDGLKNLLASGLLSADVLAQFTSQGPEVKRFLVKDVKPAKNPMA